MENNNIKFIAGNALDVLKTMKNNSVQCCVTSPPYYGLRDYGVGGQIGLELTLDEYVSKLVKVFREVKRVLKDDGTLWLNIGDSYAGSGKGNNPNGKQGTNKGTRFESPTSGYSPEGCKPKDLIGIPWMVSFALRADGWYLRSDIIWAKPNPMPESVKDRPTKSHEYIFLLTKDKKYFYDYEAVLEPANYDGRKDTKFKGSIKNYDGIMPGGHPQSFTQDGYERWSNKIRGFKTKAQISDNQHHGNDINYNDNGGLPARNKRDVWVVSTKPYKGAHFATFPEKLIEPCILAGTKEGDIVLDPFSGAGTTGIVCARHNRKYIGIDINPEYITLSEERLKRLEIK